MAALPNALVGHWQHPTWPTGCTVILPQTPAIGGVWVGGGAPGTRETDVLAPMAAVARVDGLLLTGGSAFGLAAAGGVMRYLAERGIGFPVGTVRVPIVPGAVLFDLHGDGPPVYPDDAAGYAACQATTSEAAEGRVGAGRGATLGKLLGRAGLMPSGLAVVAGELPSGARVGVIAATNPLGSVIDESGGVIAGPRGLDGRYADSQALAEALPADLAHANTTLVAVVTDAALDKVDATRVARIAHDGLARAIVPVHTSFDGDVVFTLSTGAVPAAIDAVAALATRLVAGAIRRAARLANPPASPWPG